MNVNVIYLVITIYMTNVGKAGKDVGLSFNWSKLEALPVKTTAKIRKLDGKYVPEKGSMVYLGSSLAADGKIGTELNRRIGSAQSDFRTLQRVWSHSSLPRQKRIDIFQACIVSKALYGLEVACLNVSEKRRLDGFHARCLRRICKIQPSYVSRVSNATVLATAQQQPLTRELLRRQQLYFGELVRRPGEDPVRRSVLEPEGLQPRVLPGARRVGRPRTSWIKSALEESQRVAGRHVETDIYNKTLWKRKVNRYFSHGRE
jgi:hypothetical protein